MSYKTQLLGQAVFHGVPNATARSGFRGPTPSFEWYEGVPARVGYDNLTVVVRNVLRGRNREEQNAFIAFRSHYVFDSHFAMVATPREQGRV